MDWWVIDTLRRRSGSSKDGLLLCSLCPALPDSPLIRTHRPILAVLHCCACCWRTGRWPRVEFCHLPVAVMLLARSLAGRQLALSICGCARCCLIALCGLWSMTSYASDPRTRAWRSQHITFAYPRSLPVVRVVFCSFIAPAYPYTVVAPVNRPPQQ